MEVDETTQNVLFVIDHHGEELLVPAQEEFMVEMDQINRKIVLDLPEGLLTLDESPEIF